MAVACLNVKPASCHFGKMNQCTEYFVKLLLGIPADNKRPDSMPHDLGVQSDHQMSICFPRVSATNICPNGRGNGGLWGSLGESFLLLPAQRLGEIVLIRNAISTFSIAAANSTARVQFIWVLATFSMPKATSFGLAKQ